MTKRQSEIVQFALAFLASNLEPEVADMVDEHYLNEPEPQRISGEEIDATVEAFMQLL